MKFKQLVFYLFLLPLASQAENTVTTLSDIVEQLELRIQGHGLFSQKKHYKILTRPLTSSGDFTFKRHTGVLWRTLHPISSSVFITETGITVYTDKHTKVKNNNATAFAGKVFNAILTGDAKMLNNSFDIDINPGKISNSWLMILTPKSSILKKALSSIEIEGDTQIKTVILNEANENYTVITFSSLEAVTELPEEFVHAKPR